MVVIEPYCAYTEEKSVDSNINMDGWGSISCSVHKHASLSFIHTKKYVHLTKQPLLPYCLIPA